MIEAVPPKPSIISMIQDSNRTNSENIIILKEVLYRLTGDREQEAPTPPTHESIRGQLSDTIQQAHEIEVLARDIFEAL